MEQQARQTVLRGEAFRQQNENERQMNLLQLKAGRQQAQRDFRASMQAQNQAIMGGVGDIVGAGLQGFAAGGGFAEGGFKMDTFLGRESATTDSFTDKFSFLNPEAKFNRTNPYTDSAGEEGYGTVQRRNPYTGKLEEVEYSQRSVHSIK